jgi:hypothetical protein
MTNMNTLSIVAIPAATTISSTPFLVRKRAFFQWITSLQGMLSIVLYKKLHVFWLKKSKRWTTQTKKQIYFVQTLILVYKNY